MAASFLGEFPSAEGSHLKNGWQVMPSPQKWPAPNNKLVQGLKTAHSPWLRMGHLCVLLCSIDASGIRLKTSFSQTFASASPAPLTSLRTPVRAVPQQPPAQESLPASALRESLESLCKIHTLNGSSPHFVHLSIFFTQKQNKDRVTDFVLRGN